MPMVVVTMVVVVGMRAGHRWNRNCRKNEEGDEMAHGALPYPVGMTVARPTGRRMN